MQRWHACRYQMMCKDIKSCLQAQVSSVREITNLEHILHEIAEPNYMRHVRRAKVCIKVCIDKLLICCEKVNALLIGRSSRQRNKVKLICMSASF